jgi:predicted membrane-bound spermidine synthase
VTSPQPTADPRTTVFLLGVATTVAQALLLREAMAAMGGSEMAWGTVMALWLLGMGLGSRVGVGIGSERLARVLPALVLAVTGLGIVLFRAAPALIGAASGETLTTASAAWLWIAAVVPTAFAGGMAFPILAGALGPLGGGRAYAIEATGALTGGTLLSVILVVGFGTIVSLCLALAFVTATIVWPRSRVVAFITVITGALLAPIAANSLAHAGWVWSGNPGELDDWCETRLQRLEVSDGPPTNIFADGRLIASYPDPYETLPRAHLTMLLHPNPASVFAVGCVADGSVEAMARHPVRELVVVEEDPVLLRKLPDWYGADVATALKMPQVRPVTTDPLRALSRSGPWDLVILRDPDPTTLRHNRTRTLEFFRSCRDNMKPDGILVMRIAVADTYLGGTAGRLVTTLATTVRTVFPQLTALPGEEILLIAGGPAADLDIDANRLAERLRSRGLEGSELIPEMIPLFTDRERATTLSEALDADARVNTIAHPRAVMLAGALHEAKSKPSLLRLVPDMESHSAWPLAVLLGFAALALMARGLIRRPPVTTTAAAVGLSSMGWWLLLIATWQATRGSVYSEIGALTAVFMAGLAGGAGLVCRSSTPSRRLPLVLVAGAVLSLLIAGGIAVRFPLIAVPVLLIAGGVLTGAAFPGLTALGHRSSRHSAGIAFAADEVGAAAGALVVGIVAIPWAGLTATALGLAFLSIAAIPAVLMTLRRERLRRSSSESESKETRH